jgi:hypothetical protein
MAHSVDDKIRGERDAYVSESEKPRWGWWLCGAGFVAAIILVTSLLSPYVRHQWALSLFRQNTRYTELAFNHPAALPVTAIRGKGVHVSFSITNDDSSPIFYRYVIASGSGTKLRSLSSSSKTVVSGAVWRVDKVIVPKCSKTICRVQVSLPRQGEKIDYILSLKSGERTQKKQ